jgi:hypothetical protein
MLGKACFRKCPSFFEPTLPSSYSQIRGGLGDHAFPSTLIFRIELNLTLSFYKLYFVSKTQFDVNIDFLKVYFIFGTQFDVNLIRIILCLKVIPKAWFENIITQFAKDIFNTYKPKIHKYCMFFLFLWGQFHKPSK